jgi:apolipoprotein D and lipocalin family protein
MAVFAALCLLVPASVIAAQRDGLEVVPEVDLQRYQGTWYEIARLPNRFQDDCVGNVSAEYRLRADGRIDVTNSCRDKRGETKVARGEARRVAGKPTSVLEVRFAPRWLALLPFVWGDYQIIELAADYSHVMVGTPDRKYLWILARQPVLDSATRERLEQSAARQGFDVSRLLTTKQAE